MTFRTSSDCIKQSVFVSASGGKYVVRQCIHRFLHIMQIRVRIAGRGLNIGVTQNPLRAAHILVCFVGEGSKGVTAAVG